jgi:hypothetical protein
MQARVPMTVALKMMIMKKEVCPAKVEARFPLRRFRPTSKAEEVITTTQITSVIFQSKEVSCTAGICTTQGSQKSNTKHFSTCAVSNRFRLTLSREKEQLSCCRIAFNPESLQ